MRVSVILLALAVSACAPKYQAPEEIIEIAAPTGAAVFGRDVIEVRAFYSPDIALAELGDAQCQVSFGATNVTLSTPRFISVPRLDNPPTLNANCKVQLGPRVAQETASIDPFEVEKTDLNKRRLYPPKLDVRFQN